MTSLRIFISSVQGEFAPERAALQDYLRGDALMRRFFEPFLFEDVPAADRRADEVYLDEVASCDIYLGLLGDEYGFEDAEGVSPQRARGQDDSSNHRRSAGEATRGKSNGSTGCHQARPPDGREKSAGRQAGRKPAKRAKRRNAGEDHKDRSGHGLQLGHESAINLTESDSKPDMNRTSRTREEVLATVGKVILSAAGRRGSGDEVGDRVGERLTANWQRMLELLFRSPGCPRRNWRRSSVSQRRPLRSGQSHGHRAGGIRS